MVCETRMVKMLVSCMILLIWLPFVTTQTFQLYTIGIYSNCSESVENRTQFLIETSLVTEYYRQIIDERNAEHNTGELIQHEVYDVCDNTTYLAEIIQDLTLSERYKLQYGYHKYTNSKILAIFAQMPKRMTDFLIASVIDDIPIINLDTELLADGSIYNPIQSFVNDLIQIVQNFGWRKVKLIAITKREFPYLLYYRRSIEKLKELNICFELYEIDPDEITNQTSFIMPPQNLPIVLFGGFSQTMKFVVKVGNLYGYPPYLYVTHDLTNMYRHLGIFKNPSLIYIDLFRHDRTAAMSPSNYYQPPPLSPAIADRQRYQMVYKMIAYDYLVMGVKYNKPDRDFNVFKFLNDRKYRAESLHKTIFGNVEYNIFQGPGDPYILNLNNEASQDTVRTQIGNRSALSICEKPVCSKGYQLIYGNVSESHFTWKCALCPKNTYKTMSGNTACQKCTGRYKIDNGKRTECIDPYTNRNIDFSNTEFVVLLALTVLGLTLTVFTMAVFLINRKTPIVSCSDYTISMIHMSIIGLILITIPLTFIGKPNFISCTARLCSMSVLYTINVAIVFIKSQKLLKAFLSRVKVTAEEVNRTKAIQGATLLLFLTCINFLFATTIYRRPIMIAEALYPEQLISMHYCNNSFHYSILIGSAMVIQLMCSIQAFRGRNLPSVINDGVVIMYATFTLTIVFSVNFVIVNAQELPVKELFQNLAITINNLVIVFLLYGQKGVRILAYPHHNTREHFRQVRMNERRQNIDQTVELRRQ
ncbi:uncharacterized protein [Clytia hemisphaerica]|uniref:uncharacterized protein n=1 Tax=Clytia hemisphaerica TaxID=252671 RepID=UPI0034D4F612